MTETIGIGVTTYKRKDLLKVCLDNIHKHTERPFLLHVAEDTDADRRGIALRKNECLNALKDCDYIFLFDDVCYPISDGWVQFFIDAHKKSGFHHLCYLNDKIHTEKSNYFIDNYIIKSYTTCGGVFLFITNEVIKKVGGFYDKYDLYGFEHLGYSLRIFMAKLVPEMYLSVEDTDKYLYSHDYQEKDFSSSIDYNSRVEMSEKGKRIFEVDAKEIYRPIVWEKKF